MESNLFLHLRSFASLTAAYMNETVRDEVMCKQAMDIYPDF